MGKFNRKGGGGGGGGSSGGSMGKGGSEGSKRRAYDGLKVLERGGAGQHSQTTKQAKRWADKKHADKKRAALHRLYGEMSEQEKKPIAGVFDGDDAPAVARPPAAVSLDALESGSSSDCSLSDEEVADDQIMFKDEALQRVWHPASLAKRPKKDVSAAPAGALSTGSSAGGKASKAKRLAAAQGPSAVGSFMEVPGWDADESGGEGDGEVGKKRKGGKTKAPLPEKISFGDKQRPEVLAVLSKKADEKKKQIEREKAAALEARCVW
jgi:hypothetical protein